MIRLVAMVLTATALVCGAGTLLLSCSWRTGLRVLLDLLTAAGLIRLAGTHDWPGIGAAAAIVIIRTAVSAALSGGVPGGWSRPRIRFRGGWPPPGGLPPFVPRRDVVHLPWRLTAGRPMISRSDR